MNGTYLRAAVAVLALALAITAFQLCCAQAPHPPITDVAEPIRSRSVEPSPELQTDMSDVGEMPTQRREVLSEELAVEEEATPKEMQFWCKVVTQDGGHPIEGVVVAQLETATDPAGVSFLSEDPAKSNKDGFVQLFHSCNSLCVASVDAPGFDREIILVSTQHASREDAMQIRMAYSSSQSATLIVHLKKADLSPIAGAPVELEAHDEPDRDWMRDLPGSPPRRQWTGLTDENGRCLFRGLPPEVPIHAHSTQEGLRLPSKPQEVNLKPREQKEVTWVAPESPQVKGFLLDQFGVPVTGQEMWLIRDASNGRDERERIYFRPFDQSNILASTKTGALGQFEFAGTVMGRWYVGPAPRGISETDNDPDRVSATGTAFLLEASGAQVELTVQVHRGLYLDGLVTRPGEEDPQRTSLRAESPLGRLTASSEGPEFRLGPLEPVEHHLYWSISGESFASELWIVASPSQGAVHLELASLPAGGQISGYFVDAASGERVDAKVIAFHEETGRTVAKISARPKYSFGDLRPGIYHLTAISPEGLAGTLGDVKLGSGEHIEELEIQLKDGTELRLSHDGVTTFRFDIHIGDKVVARVSVPPGEPTLATVPPGEMTVLGVGTGSAEVVVTCGPGETVDIKLKAD